MIGTEVWGRDDGQMADVVGPISNELVLRVDCSGGPTFREMLDRVSRVWAEAQQHQAMPFGTLLDELSVPRDLSRNPLFQISFNRRHAEESTVTQLASLWEPVRFESRTEILDLSASVTERDNEVELRFSYSTDLFDQTSIERLLGHFRTLLQAAVENPERTVSRLPLLTAAEQRQILVEWNDTAVDYPRDMALNEFVERQADRTPDAPAVVFESEQLTYRQLNQRANQLAHSLSQAGHRP